MLSNYTAKAIETIHLVVYEVTLPYSTPLSVILTAQTAKHGVMDIFTDVFNKFDSSPMIRIISDTKLPFEDGVLYQELLYEYFINYKYENNVDWYGSHHAYKVGVDHCVQALHLLMDGNRPPTLYEKAEDKLSF